MSPNCHNNRVRFRFDLCVRLWGWGQTHRPAGQWWPGRETAWTLWSEVGGCCSWPAHACRSPVHTRTPCRWWELLSPEHDTNWEAKADVRHQIKNFPLRAFLNSLVLHFSHINLILFDAEWFLLGFIVVQDHLSHQHHQLIHIPPRLQHKVAWMTRHRHVHVQVTSWKKKVSSVLAQFFQ